MRFVIGSMTMPFSLSNKERLLWLEPWIEESRKGLLENNLTIDLVFSYEQGIEDSMKYLLNNPNLGYVLMMNNELIGPSGVILRMIYNPESEQILNEIKK